MSKAFGYVQYNTEQYSRFQYSQCGLCLKTYQSDIFNNWVKTELITGTAQSVNEVSSVAVINGKFTMDALILAKKVFNMLNAIAVSGNTYSDWIRAVYDHVYNGAEEIPVYMGGLSKEIVFQEVVSNSTTETSDGLEPLGTLAGRGHLSNKHKGGRVRISVNEPGYIMGIVSITPRIDYSQGNDWDMVDLYSMNDLHKPDLDGIGWEDLLADRLNAAGTTVNNQLIPTSVTIGKQPAWINYMTNFNKCCGHFAEKNKSMFMTLNRQYEVSGAMDESDYTTYINPMKYNQNFADASLDSQNFWIQIAVDAIARRKMSAKIMPNL